jgi:hypothetical protein
LPLVLRRRLPLLLALLALAFAPHAYAAAPPRTLTIGAAETASQVPDPVVAKTKMDLAKLAGFGAIRLSAIWKPGQSAPDADQLAGLQASALAAQLDDIQLYLAVSHAGSATTPRTPQARTEFAQFLTSLAQALPTVRDFIIGNEPNLNRFWMPQFGSRGRDVAAPAYGLLLAQAYDALKAVSPDINVIGGAVSPHGSDNPRQARQTHSPTAFIRDLGRAYRASRRSKPIMDAFAIHPYGDSSRSLPSARHPRSKTISLADYDKLVKLLKQAFTGTAQPGAKLPIVYAEYGIQSQIPADKLAAYGNVTVPAARDAVPEFVQGQRYRQAFKIAFCQPTVRALLVFHVSDEPDLDRWQSGVYYADDTPKDSFPVVKASAEAARAGMLTRCRRR